MLDMGSALNPDIRATDAIDHETNIKLLKKEEMSNINQQAIPLGLSRTKAMHLLICTEERTMKSSDDLKTKGE